jgi:predicted TIM-barrel fold metal-dependent hydrolase
MYGTDVTLNETDGQFTIGTDELRELWYDQWLFLATDSVISINDLDGQKVKGLQLPRKVIDKIYQKNAERFLKINRN